MRRYIRGTPQERFWSYVKKTPHCWLWTASKIGKGYGNFSRSPKEAPRTTYAHRLSYEWEVGPIPSGMMVCHRCDNPLCVRPSHLFLGTNTDNMHDASIKGRLVREPSLYCPKGHEFTPENTISRKRTATHHEQRLCRQCDLARQARFRARKRTRR